MSVVIDNLSYRYPTAREYVVRDINIDINQGELVLIAGPTGSGKTTLSYIISGIVQSYIGGELIGNISIDGKEIKSIKDSQGLLGYIFQSFENQLLSLSVQDEILLAPINNGIDFNSAKKIVDELINVFNLENLRDRYVYNLSSGEMQKVAIASMLAMKPKVLLLDEPFSQLDDQSTEILINKLLNLKEKGLTIIIIEHRIYKLLNLVDRLILISQGRVVYNGDPKKGESMAKKLGLRIDSFESKTKKFKAPSDTILSVENLWVNRASETDVLKGVNLSLNKGEFISIYGPNGAGKTTLALTLINVLSRKRGVIKLKGSISMVFQNPDQNLVFSTVEDEILKPAINSGLSKEQAKELAKMLLEAFNLTHLRSRHPLTLSKGERYRLAVASSLASNPNILILDEPTYGQDYRGITAILEKLREFSEDKGLSVIILTNDWEFANAFSDAIYLLKDGVLVEKLSGG